MADWASLSTSDRFKALSDEDRGLVANAFFDREYAPRLANDDIEIVRSAFMDRLNAPEPEEDSGLLSSIARGARQSGRMVGATLDTIKGDLADVEDYAMQTDIAGATETPEDLKALYSDLANIDREQGALGQIGDTLSSAADNKMGTAHLLAEQVPNTAIALVPGVAGAELGAIAGTAILPGIGTAIGGTLGFMSGMFLGTALLEIGGKAIEKAKGGFTGEERWKSIIEGAIKSGVITGVDTVTLGVGGKVGATLARAANKAGAQANAKVLIDAGVDMSSPVTINAALHADKALLGAAKKAGTVAAKEAITTGRKIGIASTGMTMETVGEGAGEYVGELAATGEGDVVDATIESLAGASMSMIETAYNYNEATSADNSAKDIFENAPTDYTPSAPPSNATPPQTTNEAAADLANDLAADLIETEEDAATIAEVEQVIRSGESKRAGLEAYEARRQAAAQTATPVMQPPSQTLHPTAFTEPSSTVPFTPPTQNGSENTVLEQVDSHTVQNTPEAAQNKAVEPDIRSPDISETTTENDIAAPKGAPGAQKPTETAEKSDDSALLDMFLHGGKEEASQRKSDMDELATIEAKATAEYDRFNNAEYKKNDKRLKFGDAETDRGEARPGVISKSIGDINEKNRQGRIKNAKAVISSVHKMRKKLLEDATLKLSDIIDDYDHGLSDSDKTMLEGYGRTQTAEKPAVKEPWQMTESEWYSEWDNTKVDYTGSQGNTSNATSAKGEDAHLQSILDRQKFLKMSLKDNVVDGLPIPARHYQVVEKALSEGKPVPPEVLKDHPDLQQDHIPEAGKKGEAKQDQETDTGTALFKHGDASKDLPPMPSNVLLETIKGVFAGLRRAGYRHAPKAIVVRRDAAVDSHDITFSELPAGLLKHAKRQNKGYDDVDGVYHKGKLYLFADNLKTQEHVEAAIFHELYGHEGLNKLFGKDVNTALNRFFLAIGGSKGLIRLADQHNINLKGYAKDLIDGKYDRETRNGILIQELVSHIAQKGEPKMKQKAVELIGAIQNWLRKHGFPGLSKMNGFDLAYLVKSAREAARRGKGEGNYNYAVFDDADVEITAKFSRTSTKPWPKGFSSLFAHTTVGKVKSHPDFDAAKAGDEKAAMRLVADLTKPERLKALAEKYPDAVVVGVMEQEPTGTNQIPRALAAALSTHGLKVDSEIVSASKTSRKLLNAVERLISRKVFTGNVIKGQTYIIADDVATQGGTFQDLRHYIENNGGHVVAASSLAFSAGSNIIAIREATISALESKFGRNEIEELLYEENIAGSIEALTESEAKAILRFNTLDRLKSRILEARRKTGIGRDDAGPGTSNSLSSKLFSQTTPSGGLSRSEAETELRKDKRLGKLIDSGKLKVVASEYGLPKKVIFGSGGDSLSGAYLNGIAYIVAGKNTAETVTATALHEITHAAMDKYGDSFLTRGKQAKLRKQLHTIYRMASKSSGTVNKFFQDAFDTIPANTKSSSKLDELAGYVVEKYVNDPQSAPNSVVRWVKDFIAAIKMAIFKHTGVLIGKLKPQDLLAIAKAYASFEARKAASTEHVASGEVSLAIALRSMSKEYGITVEEAKRQYDEVVARYKGTEQWLKAPNGEDSNLDGRQWVQVRTPAFKAWFGEWEADSAIVDKAQSFIRESVAGKTLRPIKLWDVDSWTATEINSLIGGDVSGFSFELNSNDVRHAIDTHGDPKIEAKKKQEAITEQDLLAIPYILKSPDYIRVGSTRGSRPSVIFGKKVNGAIEFVEVVLKKGVLSNKTMWKKREPQRHQVTFDPARGSSSSLYRSIDDFLERSKPSKVVDKNGEPMVVDVSGHHAFAGRAIGKVDFSKAVASIINSSHYDKYILRTMPDDYPSFYNVGEKPMPSKVWELSEGGDYIPLDEDSETVSGVDVTPEFLDDAIAEDIADIASIPIHKSIGGGYYFGDNISLIAGDRGALETWNEDIGEGVVDAETALVLHAWYRDERGRMHEIKSATGNTGQFGPTGNILKSVKQGQPLFSKREQQAQEVHDDSWDTDEKLIERVEAMALYRFNRIRKLQDHIIGDKNAPEGIDAVKKEALFYGKVGERFEKIEREHIDPAMEILKEADLSITDLEQYMYAIHAPERNAAILEIDPSNKNGSGISNKQAAEILAGFNSEQSAELTKAAQYIRSMLDNSLDLSVSKGLITAAQRDTLKNKYPNYVPLNGNVVDEQEIKMLTGKKFDIRGKEFRRALGRSTPATNMLAHAVAKAEATAIRAEKADVGQAIAKLYLETQDASIWVLHKIKTEQVMDEKGQFIEAITNLDEVGEYVTTKTKRVKGGKVVHVIDPSWTKEPNIFAFKAGGKQYYLDIKDEALARQLKGLGVDQSGPVIRMLGMINRFLSAVYTSLNPDFVFTNASRDFQTALANIYSQSEHFEGMHDNPEKIMKQLKRDVAKNWGKAAKAIFKHEFEMAEDGSDFRKWFDEYRESGAKIAFYSMQDIESIQSELESKSRKGQLTKASFMKVAKFVKSSNAAVENAIRLSTYAALRERGISRQNAAFVSRNLTVDFNRKGEMGSTMNALWLFYNASIQGGRVVYNITRHLIASKKGRAAIAGSIALGYFLAELARAGMGDDDDGRDKWDNIPDYQKRRNIVIGYGTDDDDIFKIPLPYGLNLLPNLGYWLNDVVNYQTSDGRKGKSPMKVAIESVTAFVSSTNPVGMIYPSIMTPFVEILATNENFAGYQINKEASPYAKFDLPDSETYYKRYEDSWAQSLASALNFATGGDKRHSGVVDLGPGTIRYMWKFATGGMGATAGMLIDIANPNVETEVHRVPVIRNFGAAIPKRKQVNDYREHIKEPLNMLDLFDHAKGSEKASIMIENRPMIILGRKAKVSEKTMRSLYRQRKKAYGRDDKDAAQRINNLIKQKAAAYNRLYYESVR